MRDLSYTGSEVVLEAGDDMRDRFGRFVGHLTNRAAAAFPDDSRLVQSATHYRPSLENVHHPGELEPLVEQHLQSGPGFVVDLSDNTLSRFREQRNVNGTGRHEVRNEPFVLYAEIVRFGEFYVEEVPAESFPERRVPLRIHDASHFRNNGRLESLRVICHEEETKE
jgi:hypothetical protein